MLKFTARASQAVLLCWPDGTNPLDQYERGEPLDKELVWQITQRQPPKTNDGARYVLSADRAGIFVVTPTDRVITVLRMGETQRRILAGPVEVHVPPPPAQLKQPKSFAVQSETSGYPPDAALFLTFEFFMDARSAERKMSKAQIEVGCAVCEASIQPGEWLMLVRTTSPKPKSRVARVCMACLMKRKAEVWDE